MVGVDDLMTIGAFARRTGLSVSALRFYAGQRLLMPAEVDRTNGYRRYAEAQVPDAMLVRDLRRLDMPLREIAQALQRPEHDRKLLIERHLHRLEQVVHRAQTLARTMGVDQRADDSTKEIPMPNTTQTSPPPPTRSATLHGIDLAATLDQILPAAGTDPELPHLMTVLIEAKDDSIRFVTTDRFRLAVRDLVPARLDGDFSAVVPAATLAHWRTALAKTNSSSAAPLLLEVTVDQRQLRVTGGDIDLTAPLMPVTFPDYERYLQPADNVTSVMVDRSQLLAALEGHVSGSSDEGSTVHLSTSPGGVRIAAAHDNTDDGDAAHDDDDRATQLEATCEGPTQTVSINAGFAIDATANAVSADMVIEIENSLDPVLFRSADDGTFTTRIMPIRLD